MPHDTRLDPREILAELGIPDVHVVEQAHGGNDTSIWRVEHDSQVSALRVFPAGRDAGAAHERRAMELAGRHSIAVPDVRHAGAWRNRPALLLSWCAGEPLAQALQARPWQAWGLMRAFGAMQARIHQVDAAELVVPGFSWIDWKRAADPLLAERLRQISDPMPRLLHLDYHPLNVLVANRQVSAVLDWANAAAGDPRADLARTWTILLVEPHYPNGEPLWYRAMRFMAVRAWLSGYRRVTAPPREMAPFFAWAGAVMVADLAPRVGNPDSWWQARHLEQIRRWAERWRSGR